MAGLQVAMMGIPLSLGIAVASGAPPVCGIISAIIAGFVFPFLGGAYITISGPAAGLAPALLAGTLALGMEDLEAGYPLLLVAIALVGVVQVILSISQCREIRAVFSHLGGRRHVDGDRHADHRQTSSGISRVHHAAHQIHSQSPHADPRTGHGPESLDLRHRSRDPLPPFFISGILARIQGTWPKLVPVPLVVIVLAGLASWLLGLEEKWLIHVPLDIFEHGIVFPHFVEAFSRPDLYGPLLLIIITLTLIDGTESLATIAAIDKIDPFKRKSNPKDTAGDGHLQH